MKASILSKLENLSERLQELNALLADADTIANQKRFRELSQELAQLTPVAEGSEQFRPAQGSQRR